MRLTIGPLSPSVYWRRRGVVLGALLIVILLIGYSCSSGGGSSTKTAGPQRSASPTPQPSASVLFPSNEPTGVAAGPNNAATASDSSSAVNSTGNAANQAGTCTDSELSVKPEPEAASVHQGVPVRFMIKIKNVSTRTCVRDLGAQMQELYLQQGNAKQWTSDACVKRGSTGTDVRTFPPNHEFSYWVIWEGKGTAQGCENQPWMAKGTYQLFGRLGTKVSEPVAFTVTG
jgi:hypothetical protein